MRNSVFSRFLSVLGARSAVLLLGLFTSPILVRLVGSGRYGDYAFVLSVLGITMIFVNAGIFDGTRKYIAEGHDRNGWAEQVFGFYLVVAVVLAAVVAAGYVLVGVSGIPGRLLAPPFDTYLYLLAGLVVARQLYSVARGGLMGLGLESQSEPLQLVQKVVFAIFGLGLAALGHGVVGLLAGQLIGWLVAATVAMVLLARRLDLWVVFRYKAPSVPRRELLSFNVLSVVLILLTASLYHVDILLLRPLAGSRSTGYYRAALTIAELIWFVPNVAQTVFLHSASDLWSRGETDRITRLASRATRYNLGLSLLLTIGMAALAADFMPIYYGTEFRASVEPLLLLLPGALGFALARPIFAVGQGKGALRVLIAATGAASVINLCLNIVLIPKYGASGAAVATSLGYGSMFVFHVFSARRIGFDPLDDLRIGRIVLVAVASAPIIGALSIGIASPFVSLLVVPPAGLLVYGALSLRLGVIDHNEVIRMTERLPDSVAHYAERLIGIVY